MKKTGMLYLILIVFFSCNQDKKTINFKIKNNSELTIDSLKIKLNNSSVKLNSKLYSNGNIKIKMVYVKPKDFSGANVFIIYYYQNGRGYYSNFGYHSGTALIDETYNLFIFNEGVSEINRKSMHLKENRHEIEQEQ
ncbi:MAG TPA: hypothetical protein VFM72_01435 [Aequorivita sp.]|nr:hypothetical protein [Aequorivita sp.]